MLNVILRSASEFDWDFLCAVLESCMREYAERTSGNWRPEPRDNFRPEVHRIIQCDGIEIGCVALIEGPDALMLEKLYILPTYQRGGIGTSLLRRLVERAHVSEKPIHLRVLRVNPARQLYERNGFKANRSSDERRFMSYAVPKL